MASSATGRDGWSGTCGADVRRDSTRLGDGTVDLLVIGGGIYGAWIAYDAALRGLSVVLVERDDWGSGTSSASSKLIHGGLRYLEHGHLALVAKALRERARLLRLGPHRVWPLRFLVPVFGDSRMPRAGFLAGLALYDGLAGSHPGMPRHRSLARTELQEQAPWLAAADLRGGFSYGDAGTDDARLTLELVDGAIQAGALALNHAAAGALLRDGAGRVHGALVHDQPSGRQVEVRARCTVAAVGPWVRQLPGCDPGPVRFSKGVHLVLPPLPGAEAGTKVGQALLLTAPSDRRVFFLIPWYGATLVGTTDTDHHGDPDALRVEDAEVDYLLSAVRSRCPGLGWTPDAVRASFAGVRTLQGAGGRQVGAVTREWTLVQSSPGLLVPVGGKLTSARVEAARTIDVVMDHLGRSGMPSLTSCRRLPWAPREPWPVWAPVNLTLGLRLGLDAETAATCLRRHGRHVDRLWQRLRRFPAEAARIDVRHPFCWAEAALAVRDEMAATEADVLRRRIPLSILGKQLPEVTRRVARLLAGGDG